MSRSDLSDITIILDRSGSMDAIANDTVGGVARFIEDQRKLPGAATLTLVQFDHEYDVVHAALPLASVPPFTRERFVPRGNTALLDAIGRTIVSTGERLAALAEADRPGHVIVVIVTDGLENSSKEYRRSQIHDMIKHQQETYQWTFLFLAANQDAIATAATVGVPPTAAMSFAPTTQGVSEAYRATSGIVGSLRSGGVARGYSDEDRAKQRKEGAV